MCLVVTFVKTVPLQTLWMVAFSYFFSDCGVVAVTLISVSLAFLYIDFFSLRGKQNVQTSESSAQHINIEQA